MSSVRPNHLLARDGLLQRLHLGGTGRILEKHDEQMGGISLGLLAERIAQHHRLPFLGGANHEMGLKLQALLGLGLEEALELGGAS